MKVYFKCVLYNRFTLIGYTGFIVSLGIFIAYFFSKPELEPAARILWILLIYFSFSGEVLCLVGTGFGFQTKTAYERTRDHIRAFGKVDDRFCAIYGTHYCDRAGIRMAMAEAMLNSFH